MPHIRNPKSDLILLHVIKTQKFIGLILFLSVCCCNPYIETTTKNFCHHKSSHYSVCNNTATICHTFPLFCVSHSQIHVVWSTEILRKTYSSQGSVAPDNFNSVHTKLKCCVCFILSYLHNFTIPHVIIQSAMRPGDFPLFQLIHSCVCMVGHVHVYLSTLHIILLLGFGLEF